MHSGIITITQINLYALKKEVIHRQKYNNN